MTGRMNWSGVWEAASAVARDFDGGLGEAVGEVIVGFAVWEVVGGRR